MECVEFTLEKHAFCLSNETLRGKFGSELFFGRVVGVKIEFTNQFYENMNDINEKKAGTTIEAIMQYFQILFALRALVSKYSVCNFLTK